MARRSGSSNKSPAGRRSGPGRLRIVAGNWRSRVLDIADVPGLRPTSERIRETLFNWLAEAVVGARCLDLFAGTGALGLEALSRGADHVVFIEKSVGAAATLRKNIASLNADVADVYTIDAVQFLKDPAARPFDIVFLDPPFADDQLEELCRLLCENHCLTAGASVYMEQDRGQTLPELPEGWNLLRNKTAGNVRYMLVTAAAKLESTGDA